MSVEVAVRYATRRPWAPAPVSLRRWARLAADGQRGELGIRVVGAAEGRRLNAQWRGRDRATNVLSFPLMAEGPAGRRLLGDLVVCAPVLAREAREQGKELRAHWAHIVIHGTLHLLGYDHRRAAEARRMERRERQLLSTLGYPDPYGD